MSTTMAPGAVVGSGAASARERRWPGDRCRARATTSLFTYMSKEGIRWYPKWNHNMRTQMRSFSWC